MLEDTTIVLATGHGQNYLIRRYFPQIPHRVYKSLMFTKYTVAVSYTITMNYLRRLFRRSRAPQKPVALPSSSIQSLPVEILLCILDLLPPASAVAFSLSCHQLKNIFGTRNSINLALSTEDTLALLELLARGLPNQIVCAPCKRLHAMENMYRYNSASYTCDRRTAQYASMRLPACVSRDRDGNGNISELFGTAAFKMAMKRYHQEPECTELLEMMSTRKVLSRESNSYAWQFREECCIIQGHLMQQRQSVYISRKGLPLSTISSFMNDPPSEFICRHVDFRTSEYLAGAGVQRCQSCCTRYRIDFMDYDDHGVAMFFTRWKDLGSSPESEIWNQYELRGILQLRYLFTGEVNVRTSTRRFQDPPLCEEDFLSAFGSDQNFRVDSILLEPSNKGDLFRLQDNRYGL